jgi:hypothetical protein
MPGRGFERGCAAAAKALARQLAAERAKAEPSVSSERIPDLRNEERQARSQVGEN